MKNIKNIKLGKGLKYYNNGKPISQKEYDLLCYNRKIDEDCIYLIGEETPKDIFNSAFKKTFTGLIFLSIILVTGFILFKIICIFPKLLFGLLLIPVGFFAYMLGDMWERGKEEK